MTVENSEMLFRAFGGDPRVAASVSENVLRQTQEMVALRVRMAEKYRNQRDDNPFYDPRVEAAQKCHGDTTSKRA